MTLLYGRTNGRSEGEKFKGVSGKKGKGVYITSKINIIRNTNNGPYVSIYFIKKEILQLLHYFSTIIIFTILSLEIYQLGSIFVKNFICRFYPNLS